METCGKYDLYVKTVRHKSQDRKKERGLGVFGNGILRQLEDVVKIQATYGAFCALRKNGTVVTWGSTKRGWG